MAKKRSKLLTGIILFIVIASTISLVAFLGQKQSFLQSTPKTASFKILQENEFGYLIERRVQLEPDTSLTSEQQTITFKDSLSSRGSEDPPSGIDNRYYKISNLQLRGLTAYVQLGDGLVEEEATKLKEFDGMCAFKPQDFPDEKGILCFVEGKVTSQSERPAKFGGLNEVIIEIPFLKNDYQCMNDVGCEEDERCMSGFCQKTTFAPIEDELPGEGLPDLQEGLPKEETIVDKIFSDEKGESIVPRVIGISFAVLVLVLIILIIWLLIRKKK